MVPNGTGPGEVRPRRPGPPRAGPPTLVWSGRTAGGRRAAPGTYFVRARLGGDEGTARVVVRR